MIEVNEAFAAVVLRFCQAVALAPDAVGVIGGTIALGHPHGATGAMVPNTALGELERVGTRVALVTVGIGDGLGTATITERV